MPTWQHVVRCIRYISQVNLSRSDKERLRDLLRQNLPWNNLVSIAETEGVAGLLYHHLRHSDLPSPPEVITQRLEDIYSRTSRNNLTIMSKVMDLSEMLNKNRIPAVALQGLSVFRLYGNPGLRPMGDMDLMVRPHHMGRLKKLLVEKGYQELFLYPAVFSKDALLLDIHTHILNLERIQSRRLIFPEDLSPMWERAVPYFDQQDCLQYYMMNLDPYDNIIALAAHAFKHSYSRLIWLTDIHESLLKLINGPADWDLLVERARSWKQEKVTLYSLLFVEKIYDFAVPVKVKYDMRIDAMSIFERKIIRMKLRGLSSDAFYIALCLCNIEKAKDKLKFTRETVFPRKEIMSQIFPRRFGEVKITDYAKRLINTIVLMCGTMRQIMRCCFKTG
ncbi:MAG: nucleotidyltransferase family protein [Thermodesulfobacteriota bacterium]|nr:nucleotidyltransferase family protein [Thermodesulfobacteriota bacterium]